MKDLEQLGEELRFPRQGPGLRCSEMEQGRDQLCAPRSYLLRDSVKQSNMSRTPVSLHHGETNPGSHVGHSATPSGHDPTKPNEYFNRISI